MVTFWNKQNVIIVTRQLMNMVLLLVTNFQIILLCINGL